MQGWNESIRGVAGPVQHRGWQWLLALALLVTACSAPGEDEPLDSPPGPEDKPTLEALNGWTDNLSTLVEGEQPVIAVNYEELEALSNGEPVELIIVVDASEADDEMERVTGTRDRSRDAPPARAYHSTMQQDIVSNALDAVEGADARTKRFGSLPLAAIQLESLEELEAIATSDDAQRVESITDVEMSLIESLPMIERANAAGLTGAGTAVAVLDTGCEYGRQAFGCTAPGQPAECKVAHAQDFAPSDGLRDDSSKHGTNCAGIVLGVAPETQILALDVFKPNGLASSLDIINAIDWVIQTKDVYNTVAMNMSLGGGFNAQPCTWDGMGAAIQSARDQGILAAVATGNNGYKNGISSPACAPAAVSVGAVYDANLGWMGWQGCTDPSTARDQVTCFSNSASFITMMAPGAMITAGGETMGGTSMAAPHVAGAIAALKSHYVEDSPDAIVNRMLADGVNVTDVNGVTKPRLKLVTPDDPEPPVDPEDPEDPEGGNVDDPEEPPVDCTVTLSPSSASVPVEGGSMVVQVGVADTCGWTASVAAEVPWIVFGNDVSGTGTGSFSVTATANDGPARSVAIDVSGTEFTLTQPAYVPPPNATLLLAWGAPLTTEATVNVTLGLGSSGAYAEYCLSQVEGPCSDWQTIPANSPATLNVPFTLQAQGNNTVYGEFKTPAGLPGPGPTMDSIVLDSFPPYGGQLLALVSSTSVKFSWPDWRDDGTGLASYRLVFSLDAFPSSCDTGSVIYEGSDTQFETNAFAAGSVVFVSLCATDGAGLVSEPAQIQVAMPEEGAASGGLAHIDAPWAVHESQVHILSEPASTLASTEVCVSNSPTCETWMSWESPLTWELSEGDGEKTVYLWFKSDEGEVSEPIVMGAYLDRLPPTDGSVLATSAGGQVFLQWSDFDDFGSGVSSFRVVHAIDTEPSSCETGQPVYEGKESTFVHAGLASGQRVNYRVCAYDSAGNLSAGAVRSITVSE